MKSICSGIVETVTKTYKQTLTDCSQFSSPIVKIIVGDPEADASDKVLLRTFYVHKDILVSNSVFFAKALNSYQSTSPDPSIAWVEAETGVVRLPEDKPEVFAEYLLLRYRGTTPLSKVPTDTSIGRDAIAELQWSLSRLYVFAEKIQDLTAKRAILTTIIESTNIKSINGSTYSVGCGPIHLLYDGTTASDPMRRFLTRSGVAFGQASWSEDAPSYHHEYLVDVVAGMWKDRPRPPKDYYAGIETVSTYLEGLEDAVGEKAGKPVPAA